MISQSDRDELERVVKVLDEADVVYRDNGLPLSASERVRYVLAELERAKKRAAPRRSHACDIPGCASCGNPPDTADDDLHANENDAFFEGDDTVLD